MQAEFQALFGAASATSGLSPTTEQVLFGAGADDEDDEEAKILRDLQIDGVDLDDTDNEEQQQASNELRGVIEEAHATAQRNYARENTELSKPTVSSRVGGEETQASASSLSSERAAEVHGLKLQAVELKRKGDIQGALAKFREAKQLQEQYSSPSGGSSQRASSNEVDIVSIPNVGHAAKQPEESAIDEDGVEVTDEDMEDPEFLSQLAKMGLTDDNHDTEAKREVNSVEQQLGVLESEIEQLKTQAVLFKRQNQIADALTCMRKIKDLESKRAALHSSTSISGIAFTQEQTESKYLGLTNHSASTKVVTRKLTLSPGASSTEQLDSDGGSVSDIEVTAEDMNDPELAAELVDLGFENPAPTEISQLKSRTPPASFSNPRLLLNAPSIDEDSLIDVFDEKSDSDEEDSSIILQPVPKPQSKLSHTPQKQEAVLGITIQENNIQFSHYTEQLEKARLTALTLKRKGDIQGALNSMRRAKQIEDLMNRKKHVSESAATEALNSVSSAKFSQQAKFQEIEQLLVDYGNRATALAKQSLPVNREKALEWVGKRKRYEAELEKLRRMRQNPLQQPPDYKIAKTTNRVEFQLPSVADDQIMVAVKTVTGLSQVAGKSIFVKFCLGFPSATPHEGQTDVVQVSDNDTFKAEIPPGQDEFAFKLSRSRGTMRLFEIKKATFEVWKPATLFRNAELVARAYQELAPLLTTCEIKTHLPFLGSNRKPCGGDIEISLQLRRPLKEKEFRLETMEELMIGEYPDFTGPIQEHPPIPTVTLQSTSDSVGSTSPIVSSPDSEPETSATTTLDDPHHVDQIVSYDVINEELGKLEAKMPSLSGAVAAELADRYDSLALKKQLLEIEMQTGKLTLDMYVERLHSRISEDRALISQLLAVNRRLDAARVLHRIKTMEKELEGTEGDSSSA